MKVPYSKLNRQDAKRAKVKERKREKSRGEKNTWTNFVIRFLPLSSLSFLGLLGVLVVNSCMGP
jgi:hypothetical protein